LRSNTKGYGGKTHYSDSQNSDTTASSGRELYYLQFSFQVASPETFGHTLVLTTRIGTRHGLHITHVKTSHVNITIHVATHRILFTIYQQHIQITYNSQSNTTHNTIHIEIYEELLATHIVTYH